MNAVSKKSSGLNPAVFGVAWLVAYAGARGVLELPDLAPWTRVAAALIPVPLFIAFLMGFLNSLRSADELQRKIQVEALAIAFWLTALLLTTLGLMQRAVTLSFEDWSYSHVWGFLPVFYFGAIAIVTRKYHSDE